MLDRNRPTGPSRLTEPAYPEYHDEHVAECATEAEAWRWWKEVIAPMTAKALTMHYQILNCGDGEGGCAMEVLGSELEKLGVRKYISMSLAVTSSLTKKDKQRIAKRDGHRCQFCESTDSLEIDHKAPLSRGGGDEDENLWVLCSGCNRAKGTRTVEEWFAAMESESDF